MSSSAQHGGIRSLERALGVLEDAEQEAGVHRVAVTVHDRPHRLAVSVSGPTTRMTDAVIAHAVSLLTRARQDLSAEPR